jgi:hypothetical protein
MQPNLAFRHRGIRENKNRRALARQLSHALTAPEDQFSGLPVCLCSLVRPVFYFSRLSLPGSSFRDDQPEEQVRANAGYPAWDHGDQECQPEPEGADPKEFSQPTAYAGQYSILPGPP